MSQTKVCNKCGLEKPLTSEYWHKFNGNKDGFRGQCKECRNESTRNYYQKNKTKIKEYQSRHYEENKNSRLSHQKEYYNANKKERKAYSLKYHHNNKEKISKLKKIYYLEKKEMLSNYQKKWAKENKDKVNIRWQKRLAIKKQLPATLTVKQWIRIKKDFNNSCAYCNMTEEEHLKLFNEELHQEHFIPLSEGGEYTHNNIIPSCRSCNSSKANKDFFEWYPKYEHYNKENEFFILKYLGYNKQNIQQLSIL